MTRLYYIFKYIYERLSELREGLMCLGGSREFDNKTKNIFFLTSPEYGNLGDHAIAASIIELAKDVFPNYEIYEISDLEFYAAIRWIIKNNKKEDYIFLIGGGNFGVLYPRIEYWRRLIIKKCRNAKIILFPQSSVWRGDFRDKFQLYRSAKIYSNNLNLYLMARDEATYNLMKNNFDNKIFFTPDVVLTQKYTPSESEQNHSGHSVSVLLCFRHDVEKSLNSETISKIEKILSSKGYLIKKIDTETYKVIYSEKREKILKETMREFSGSSYVITDRLHGMIFSAINGIPCLAFDNTTHKVSGVANKWLNNNNVMVYDPTAELDDQINLLLKKKKYVYNPTKAISAFNAAFEEITDKDGVSKNG